MKSSFEARIYTSYRSAFKGKSSTETRAFAVTKLLPVIRPWVSDVPRDGIVVDLGCGAGELLEAFKALGFTDLHGCDLSEEQTAVARLAFPSVKTANILDYLKEWPDKSIQAATILEAVERLRHLDAKPGLLCQSCCFGQMRRPSGRFGA